MAERSSTDSSRSSVGWTPRSTPPALTREKLTFRSLYGSIIHKAPKRVSTGRVVYDPEQIFRMLIQREGSAVFRIRVLRRALALVPVAVLACTLNSRDGMSAQVPASLLNVLSLLVAFLLSVRLNDAYTKWEAAARATERLMCVSNSILTRLTAFTLIEGAPNTALTMRLVRIRRLLVLCNVLIKKHVRSEKDLDHEKFLGLIQEEELTRFKAHATRNATDGKVDKFPSRNRFAAMLQLIMADAASMYRSGCAACHVGGGSTLTPRSLALPSARAVSLPPY